MAASATPPPAPAPETTIEALRRAVVALDYICMGTVLRRTKVCGKAACACAKDPRARHGPYYEWTRREGGRFVHTVLPPELWLRFAAASKNYRRLLRLLKAWERESVRTFRKGRTAAS